MWVGAPDEALVLISGRSSACGAQSAGINLILLSTFNSTIVEAIMMSVDSLTAVIMLTVRCCTIYQHVLWGR